MIFLDNDLPNENPFISKNGQHQLTAGPLLNERGELNECGYAFQLVKQYQRKNVRAGLFRTKEWDYYLIYNGHYGVALTIDDNSYMGLVSMSFLNFDERKEQTASPMFLFPNGKLHFPTDSSAGLISASGKGYRFSFETNNGVRMLYAHLDEFGSFGPAEAEFTLTDPPQDTMVIATPWAGHPKHFYYNQKIIGMRAEGMFSFGGRTYEFVPEQSFGLLDWGRGAWTYENTWYWSAAQGISEDHVFGFNLGYGFGDTTAASENMLFCDGKASKLGRIRFVIPKDTGDGSMSPDTEYLSPWVFTSDDARFEMTFSPILDRSSCTNAGILLSDQHQVFGYFDGTAVTDDGRAVAVQHFLGFAEKVVNFQGKVHFC